MELGFKIELYGNWMTFNQKILFKFVVRIRILTAK